MSDKKSTITFKEAKLIKGIAEGKTKQAAAMEAYDAKTPETASAIASETLRKPKVQEALEIALAKHGVDIDSATAPIGRALKHDDLEMQLKGSDRAFRLMGVGRQDGGNTNVFVQVVNEQREKYGL
jgi:hypothetical protein